MLSASAAFAADDVALNEASDDIAVEETALTVSDTSVNNQDTGVISTSENVVLSESSNNTVTKDTFHNYFDASGTILHNITSDELIFDGDFSDMDVNYITIDIPIKLTGNDAEFDGVTFVIGSNDVTVDGFMVTQTSDVYAFTISDVSGVTLSNNIIDFTALEGFDSYAIYSQTVNNLNLINNTIYYVGNTDGTVVNNAIRVEGYYEKDTSGEVTDFTPSTNIVIEGNIFHLDMPSVDVKYDEYTYEATVYSEGIALYYCENVTFVDNRVNLRYNTFSSAYGTDSLYAVAVRNNPMAYGFDDDYELIYPVQSKNALIANNTINIDGHACAYGISVGAEGFEVSGNNVTSTSETYIAHGIDVAALSFNGNVNKNKVNVSAPVSYGIYSDGSWAGPVDTTSYINNNILVDGYVACGFEVLEKYPSVINNTIVATGNYTYGVAASIHEEGQIAGNNITLLGTNIGTDPTGDPILPQNSMGVSVKGDCSITGNTINSTNIGINLVEDGEITVEKNIINVVANTGEIDNHAIIAKKIDELEIINNTITYVGASTPKADYKTTKAYAIYAINTMVDVEENTMDITVPSVGNDWEENPPGSWNYIRHSYSEGLVFDGCNLSSVTGNNITLNYNTGNYGTIYGIDVLGCDNFEITKNKIISTGENYMYGIIVEGNDFTIANNTIISKSGYYANGIDIEESTGGTIESNTIVAIAPESSYPIYGGMVGTPSLELTNNQVYGNAYFVVGVEFSGNELTLDNNTIVTKGNHTIAVGANVENLVAYENTIISNASNIGNVEIWDSIGTKTTGIISKKGTAAITENYVSTTGEYTINITNADGTVNRNYLISDELLGDASVYFTGDAIVYNNAPVSIVTNDTFFNYFDENGTILDYVISDELIFDGEFNGLDVKYITIDIPIILTGNNAELDGISFVIASNDVTVDGFMVTQTEDVAAFTIYGMSDVTLSNNVIDFTALEGFDSYAIYSQTVNNLNLINNTIYYVGNTDGTVVNNAVRVEGYYETEYDEDWGMTLVTDFTPSTNIVLEGNIFHLIMPSVDVGYDDVTYAATVYSEGIALYYCENVTFVDNHVNLRYNTFNSAYGADSLYAVSVRNNPMAYTFDDDYELIYPVQSKNALIANNTIKIDGHACAYGISVGAEGFEVSGNNITSTSETYIAHGIDVAARSFNGNVKNNKINASAPATYGIYSDGSWAGPVDTTSYINNNILVDGYVACAFEVLEKYPTLINNTIVATGNYTYGIAASIYEEGEITGNKITTTGSNIGTDPTGDPILPQNSMGVTVKGDCSITDNTINSTNIGINLVEDGEVTVENNIINVTANTGEIDNHAIIANKIDELEIINNTITYVGASTPKADYKTTKAYAIYAINTMVDVEENTMDITVPSVGNDWEENPPGSWNYIRHSYSEGLVFDGCNLSSVTGNNITLNYNTGNYGTIYGIDVLGCDNFVITENTINATGENYMYGIIVEGNDFTIANNTIISKSGYYANGIDIEESTGGTIESNTIVAIAPESSYPIYGGMVGAPSLELTNNQIYGNAYFVVGVEFSGNELTLDNNTIVTKGNYTIAVGANVENLVASENTIISNASNIGNVEIWDSIGTKTTGIISKKGTATITENYVNTTGEYAVDIADANGTVHDNYLLADDFVGDAAVYSTGDATVYNNSPLNTIIVAEDVSVAYKSTTELVATITDVNGKPLSVDLNVDFNGESYTVTADENGQISIPIDVLPCGTYVATISYAGNETYGHSSTTANVVVNQADTTITGLNTTVAYNYTKDVTIATISSVYGSGLAVKVNINLNGEEFVVKSNPKGQIRISTADLAPGTYTAEITYKGYGNYKSANGTAQITVNIGTVITAQDVSVNFSNPTRQMIATLSDVNGNPIRGNVNVTVNGATYTVKTNSLGQVTILTKDLTPKKYTATISYAGDETHKPSTATAQITVTKTDTVMTAQDISVNFSNPDGKLVATLTNAYGKALAVYVNVTFNGETYAVRADSKGQVIIPTKDLTPKTYTATISYKGNGNYYGSTVTAQVTVTKTDSVITAPDVSVAYKNPTNKTIATITNPYGKALAVYVNVTLNGEKFVVRANYRGQVSISTANLAPGTYNATISYRGNGNYNPSTATTQITVEKADTVISAPDISVAYKDVDGQLVATLTNAYGKPLSVYVTVNLNGKDYDVRADSNGQIIIPTKTLSPGNYTATITYKGNGNYNPTSTTAQITVNKADTVITAQSVTVDCGDPDGKLVATLTNAYGKALSVYVTVNLNGENYDVRADSNGQIIIPTKDLAAGTYQATITYKGNGNYNPTNTTAQIKVRAA